MVFPGGGCAVPTKKGRSLAESPLGSSVGVSREAYGQFKPGPTLAASVLALPVSIALWAPRFQLSSRADSFGSQHGHRARRRPATSSVLARRRRAPVRPRDWPATSCAGVAHSSNESGWLSRAPPDRMVKTHHHAWWRDGCPARQRNGGLPTPRGFRWSRRFRRRRPVPWYWDGRCLGCAPDPRSAPRDGTRTARRRARDHSLRRCEP